MKTTRKIINIDESLCNGCGLCVPSCAEQALQLVDTPEGKKARLVKELFCDGLGACLGHCPTGALTIEEREAEAFDESAVMARLGHSKPELKPDRPLTASPAASGHHSGHSCPGSRMMSWNAESDVGRADAASPHLESQLRQWPVQLHLVPPSAPYFQNADLCIVADCVPFAYADFHRDFVRNRALAIGCPKLDDTDAYITKISDIFRHARPRSVEVVLMEVPCCFGLLHVVKEAMTRSGMTIPLKSTVISIRGEKKLTGPGM